MTREDVLPQESNVGAEVEDITGEGTHDCNESAASVLAKGNNVTESVVSLPLEDDIAQSRAIQVAEEVLAHAMDNVNESKVDPSGKGVGITDSMVGSMVWYDI
ncbi:hypothetical protein K7X08_037231 [Anisodus acutangulus]|uniref:Uncharacterized protein n=1 Tax=Anisodus acutangulus TaxID=402998 RepID=A0A9Q1MZX1_9SOLA|nr:hypothetical protein K7X08_037231 [Anisodus acutangulus]